MAARPDSEDIAMDDAPTSHQPEVKDDAMVDDEGLDVDENENGNEYDEEEEEEEVQRIKLLPGSTETAASFEFTNEGHTLGNALRYFIMRNPDVEFCGHAIPHPSEPKMNVRIQTFEGTTAIEALEKGLRDIQELCDVVTDKFVAAATDFDKKKAATA
ncbi:putative DNA-directed RNA polymerases I and III subunit RPAC2 [Cercophora samala]|uniref:DNA-directed RNA polymerases I and III subunit RPAC2 n=1 Tax=Cercophora samala TaxID=330535 RepID=A0AA39ZMH2_9PEZI|nr:putative DNA-directed RNA polymerases I and III subunit RPAC2 [Cercophora samala]